MSIKKFFNFLIFGKISLGHKEQSIFEEKATHDNSIRYYFTTALKTRDNDDSSEAMCQVGRDMGYMATVFRFSPPVENNMAPAVEEISDRVEAQNNRLTQVKRKKDVIMLYKKRNNFVFVVRVDPTTELEISLAELPTTNNRRPVCVVVRSAQVDIPKKRIQLL